MVVNVTGYTLFVMSQHDVILMCDVDLAKCVDTARNILCALSLLVIVAYDVPL